MIMMRWTWCWTQRFQWTECLREARSRWECSAPAPLHCECRVRGIEQPFPLHSHETGNDQRKIEGGSKALNQNINHKTRVHEREIGKSETWEDLQKGRHAKQKRRVRMYLFVVGEAPILYFGSQGTHMSVVHTEKWKCCPAAGKKTGQCACDVVELWDCGLLFCM